MEYQTLPISLKKGAIFVADAHYQKGVREEFGSFVKELLQSPPPQLFLMGDIFDLLVGEIGATIKDNEEVVRDLNLLSKSCECWYLEGNHDFNLKDVFCRFKVVPREEQPLAAEANGKRVALLHGDMFMGKSYERYIGFIKKKWVLWVLRALNLNNFIVKKIQRYNASKDLCVKIEDFEKIADIKREHFREFDLIIEGHFHQNYFSKNYINLPSFSCDEKYVFYDGSKFVLKSKADNPYVKI